MSIISAGSCTRWAGRLNGLLGSRWNATKNGSAPGFVPIGRASKKSLSAEGFRVLDRRIRNFDAHELGQLNAYYQQLTPQDRERRTVSASNREKMKSVRPMRSQLAERERRLKELTEAVATCIEAAKAKGAANISADFMAEADKLAQEKREVEMEVEKLRIDIGHRERVVADEGIIADALVRFGEVMKNLPPDDQKDMVHLIVKDIKVWSIPSPDGENRERKQGQATEGGVNPDEAKPFAEADQPGVFKTRIRTKWYRVNVTIHASRVMAEVFGKAMPLT